MNATDRVKLADDLTAVADGWTLQDLQFVIGHLQTILDARLGIAAAHHGYWEAVNRSCSYQDAPER